MMVKSGAEVGQGSNQGKNGLPNRIEKGETNSWKVLKFKNEGTSRALNSNT